MLILTLKKIRKCFRSPLFTTNYPVTASNKICSKAYNYTTVDASANYLSHPNTRKTYHESS